MLHVVGVVFTAFRQAARRDRAVLAPELGELESVFVRDRSAAGDDTPDAPQPAPAPSPDAPR